MPRSTEEFIGEIRLGRKLSTVPHAASGGIAIMLALMIVLADQVWILLGARSYLAVFYLLLALGLTTATVIELLSGSGERGGSYVLVHETMGGMVGFLTGISILGGCLAVLAALLTEAASILMRVFASGRSLQPIQRITETFAPAETPTWIIAIVLLLILLILQILLAFPRRRQLLTIVAPLLVVWLILLISALPAVDLARFRASSSLNVQALNRATALLAVLFIGVESLLSSRRQILQPGRLMPQALVGSLLVTGFLLLITLVVVTGLPTPSPVGGKIFLNLLTRQVFVQEWVVLLIFLLALMLGGSGAFMAAARQANLLAIEGTLPPQLRRMVGPLPIPLTLFAVLAVAAAFLVMVADTRSLLVSGSGFFLFAMIAINAAEIYSYRHEPDRRRTFKLPFAPLFPALGILFALVLLRALPNAVLRWNVIYLVLGIIYYVAYARHKEVESHTDEVVFGRVGTAKERKERFRILVPIAPGEERHLLLRVAAALAHQLNGEVLPLQVIPVPDPLGIEEGRRTARMRNALFGWSTTYANNIGVQLHPITRLARNIPEGILDTAIEEDADLLLLSWADVRSGPEGRIGSVLSRVVRDAPCDVAAIAYEPKAPSAEDPQEATEKKGIKGNGKKTSFRPERLLVPTSGGPNAPLATRIALLLAREYEASVTVVYAARTDATPEEIRDGESRIEDTITTMRQIAAELPEADGKEPEFEDIPYEGKVVRSANVVDGIAETAKDYDLLLIGASEESLIDQVFFGNIPERVAHASESPVVIVKRYRGLPHQYAKRAWNALFNALPTLSQEEQIEVYRSIHRGARPDVDFFVMIGLSTLIATFGLLQNSTAVIIGAMLVAPLFSPLLAISLGIVQGNMRLLLLAIESTTKGVTLSIVLAALLALITPFKTPTGEILSRTEPALFDLAVAVASGMAGAYAIARKDVAAALPGVAIAAALVPPLGVIGIGLSLGDVYTTIGGGLLFATNLVAIALAASLTFLLLGFRPRGAEGRGENVRRGLTITLILFVLITIPLGTVFTRSIQISTRRALIQEVVFEEIAAEPAVELVSRDEIVVTDREDETLVTIPIYVRGDLPEDMIHILTDALHEEVGEEVRVRLVVLQTLEEDP